MTREKILNLHELSEEVTVSVLTTLGVLRMVLGEYDGESNFESLAECAFRLRDEWVGGHTDLSWTGQLRNLAVAIKYRSLYAAESDEWILSDRAKPIHWIQAALLARLEDEK